MDSPTICANCPLGNPKTVCGNGITEPPYLQLIRCPFENEYYKYPDDECCHREERRMHGEVEII